MTPADLGIDSLGLVEAIFAIEEAFDISVAVQRQRAGKIDFDISSVGAIVAACRAGRRAKTGSQPRAGLIRWARRIRRRKARQSGEKGKIRKVAGAAGTVAGRLPAPVPGWPRRCCRAPCVFLGPATTGPRRVAITGAGTVNALGQDVASTFDALANGRCGIGELDFRDVDRLAIRTRRCVAGIPQPADHPVRQVHPVHPAGRTAGGGAIGP